MKDVDECVQNIDGCAENATCSDTEGSYECTCDPGFTGDGFNCTSQSDKAIHYENCFQVEYLSTDVDECSSPYLPCDSNAICTDTIGSFTCHCKPGFTGNGTNCEGDIPTHDAAAQTDCYVFVCYIYSH